MIVTPERSQTGIGFEIPQFNGKVRTTGRQVRSRWTKGDTIDGIGVPFQGTHVITALVIPKLCVVYSV